MMWGTFVTCPGHGTLQTCLPTGGPSHDQTIPSRRRPPYGVLEGRMEIWWKPYYDRGTSAWSHRLLEAGDWAEVDSLQCHIVHWLGEGKGVVFKAGPGPLAEVGKLGVKGKTPCKDNCRCMKPAQVLELEKLVYR